MARPADTQIIAAKGVTTRRSIDSIRAALGDNTTVRLIPSSMQAGSCDAAVKLATHRVDVADAPDLPLPGCDKGVQCGCLYKIDSFEFD